MKTYISDSDILGVFQQLRIETDEERQRALFKIGFGDTVKPQTTLRFDIGFNASLPTQ